MNRIDRLFAITVLLQSKARLRAQDLADKFEVSKRTIYRDLAALSEMGIPLIALPGEGYELMTGFFLPPLVFTPTEAQALFLGAQMLRQQAGGHWPSTAADALAKIAVVLPEATRLEAERLTEIIHFIWPKANFDLDAPWLVALQQAILARRVVRLRYHSRSRSETTERELEPHQLFYSNGIWYVEGYCRLRQDIRAFRLDRVDDLSLLADHFLPRPAEHPRPHPSVEVRVRFASSMERWVRERQHYAFVQEDVSDKPDSLVMCYRVDTMTELVPWLLSWGSAAEVLSPPELRRHLRSEAEKLLNMLT